MKHPLLKTSRTGLLLIVTTWILFAFTVDPAEQGGATVVTLYVNTADIKTPNESAYCNFGQGNGVSNEEFTTVVNVGDIITWRGVSSNAPNSDVVAITSINYEGGTNVFGQNVLNDTRSAPGVVSGKVLNRTGSNKYKYKISFTVSQGGAKKGGTFHIDPKIEVH